MTIRVVVAGSVRLYRDGVVRHLSEQPHVQVVGIAGDRETVLRALDANPDVILVDTGLSNELILVRELTERAPHVRIVAVGVPEIEPMILACAEAGVAGYVTSNGSLDDMVATVECAARGECVLPPRVAGCVLRRLSSLAAGQGPTDGGQPLTVRERQVVQLVADGMSNKQIGAYLSIEVATVKHHVHNILEKLRVTRRGQVADRIRHHRASSVS